MEDLELKDVLKKVAGRILAVEKICIALSFQIWIVVMAGFYIVIAPLKSVPVMLVLGYWSAGTAIFIYIERLAWRRASLLISEGRRKTINTGIVLSWITASVIGWFVIPDLLSYTFLEKLAVGLLSFVSIAVAGMILTILIDTKKVALEMIPAALIPALLIPVVFTVRGNPMYFAGMCVVFSYGITVILYMYRAFKVA
jgi:hypothetical protein